MFYDDIAVTNLFESTSFWVCIYNWSGFLQARCLNPNYAYTCVWVVHAKIKVWKFCILKAVVLIIKSLYFATCIYLAARNHCFYEVWQERVSHYKILKILININIKNDLIDKNMHPFLIPWSFRFIKQN